MGRIVVAGANGLIGAALVRSLAMAGHEVVALVRKGEIEGTRTVRWDGRSHGEWIREIDGADAVFNFAGAPVTLRWTPENKRLIVDSRVEPTLAIRRAIESSKRPPGVWLNASAVGFYGSRGDEILDEQSPAGVDFLAKTCIAWEDAARNDRCRTVLLRTGIVLSNEGGAFPLLKKLTLAFLGGALGGGKSWMPWISLGDHLRMMHWLAFETSQEGPVNLVGPEPLRNADFMAALRKACGRPWSPPAPSFGLNLAKLVGGPEPEVALSSQRALPNVAHRGGFRFDHEDVQSAFRSLLN